MSITDVVGHLLACRNVAFAYSSSSSSDDDWDVVLHTQVRKKRRHRIRENVIERYSEEDFKSQFRISKSTFKFVLDLIQKDLVRHAPGCPRIPAHQQLMIALWKMVTTDSYRVICDKFNVGRATAVRAVRRVCRAIFLKATRFIQWPSKDCAIEIMHEFEKESGFPKTIGAIGGTHIRINPPKEMSTEYVNLKGFPSIQLQLVCDHKSVIRHCCVGQPGSVNDQTVFHSSEIAEYLKDDDAFPENGHIVGGPAYEIHQHLLTPYPDNGCLSEKQKKYNDHHSAAQMSVGRCLGLLKVRMRSLLHCLPVTRVDLMAEYIVACCVIHNICIEREDKMTVIIIPESNQKNNENLSQEVGQNEGFLKRDDVMNSL